MKLFKFLFFNRPIKFILTAGLNEKTDKIDKRISTYMLELVYPFFALFPLMFLMTFVIPVLHNMIMGQDISEYYRLISMTIINFFLFIVASNKDFFGGQSIVHRTYGYKVVDDKTNMTANEIKCLTRNLTAILFPIEFVFVLINRQRRLGDFIAGTRLVKVEKADPELILKEIENTDMGQKSKLPLTISIILFAIWTIWSWNAN
jgi:uncharacterized RDD family membrane protein YckC